MSHDVLSEVQCLYYSFQREYSQSNGVLQPEKYEHYLMEFKTYLRILDELHSIALKKTPISESEIKSLELMIRKFKRTLSSNF
jgi:hypothetical protein